MAELSTLSTQATSNESPLKKMFSSVKNEITGKGDESDELLFLNELKILVSNSSIISDFGVKIT